MDERPPVWIGHVVLHVGDLDAVAGFYGATGMREVHRASDVAICELRGGTHLILLPGREPAGAVPFDLMVDDVHATRAEWETRGLAPSAIAVDEILESFTLRDPDGRVVTVNSSHVEGPV